MKRTEKDEIINDLVEKINTSHHFYITDIAHLTVEKTNNLRRLCYGQGITLRVAKNSLIKKALEKAGSDYSGLYGVLKGASSVMFCETANVPARAIRDFRKSNDKPILKGAYVESSVYLGDNQLNVLADLKSKNELIGDILGLLQSPAKNVLGALLSGKNKIGGIVKTLSEREEK